MPRLGAIVDRALIASTPQDPTAARSVARSARAVAMYVVRLAFLSVIYYLAARLGLRYASIGESISLVWPPTGIAIAALILLGPRYWPGVFIGAFLANAGTSVPLSAAAGIASGNTIEGLVAALLFTRTAGPKPQVEQLPNVWALILKGAPLGAAASALIGVTVLERAGMLPVPVTVALVVWWAGNLLGALVVAPVILAWGTPREGGNSRPILELAALCLATVVAAELVLGEPARVALLARLEYPYLLFPFVVWAALRFGARGASLLTLTVATVAVVHTVRGGGPFIAPNALETRFALTLYLGALAVTGLVLAAAVQWERATATGELAQSEERLQLALSAARMGIWFWSLETDTVSWDENMRQLFGLGPGERVTTYQQFLQRVHPDDRERVQESVRTGLEHGGDTDYEYRILGPRGEVRWIATRSEAALNEAGRVRYMTGVCLDITQRRLAEERLSQAHRMESVGRLAGGVAHEANNQMTVVFGAAKLIQARPDLDPEIRADLDYILRAAERTAAVTAQLLAFSRQQVMKPEVIELNGFVRAWGPVLRRVMGEDCIVRLDLEPDIGRVKVDPGRLEQVLLNLALNARDAMAHGGTLTIQAYATELTAAYARLKPEAGIRPGAYAVLAVTDTGHGMDRATAARIFEPFFTTKPPGLGTGLGLSTVYGIIKQSDGYVWVYTEPGHGSTFRVYLPLTGEAPGSSPPAPAPERLSAVGQAILVVEDDESVRVIARRALEEAGYVVLLADGASAALALVAQATVPIRLAIVDLVLPGMSGPQVAQRLASLVPELRIIFTSGYPDAEIRRRGMVAPDVAFIQKPFTPEAMIRAVQQELGKAPAPVARHG